jgi:hypothetical protein
MIVVTLTSSLLFDIKNRTNGKIMTGQFVTFMIKGLLKVK